MPLATILTIFLTVFIAELGDKTQIATLLFATDTEISRWGVFLAAATALVCATAVAVLLGDFASQHLNRKVLSLIAGGGFILIGIWNLFQGLRPV